jgi:hypothetical protein
MLLAVKFYGSIHGSIILCFVIQISFIDDGL